MRPLRHAGRSVDHGGHVSPACRRSDASNARPSSPARPARAPPRRAHAASRPRRAWRRSSDGAMRLASATRIRRRQRAGRSGPCGDGIRGQIRAQQLSLDDDRACRFGRVGVRSAAGTKSGSATTSSDGPGGHCRQSGTDPAVVARRPRRSHPSARSAQRALRGQLGDGRAQAARGEHGPPITALLRSRAARGIRQRDRVAGVVRAARRTRSTLDPSSSGGERTPLREVAVRVVDGVRGAPAGLALRTRTSALPTCTNAGGKSTSSRSTRCRW